MATHDYNIANQSGAAFRTDLNNALAAIQSNNDNSSSPATTVAYQWWADTNTAVMKIRNSSNNAWIKLFTLAGGIDVESASTFKEDVTFDGATAGRDIVFDRSDNALEFADNAKATFGAGGDLEIFHNGSNSIIADTGTGNLILQTSKININNAASDEALLHATEDGSVELYYNGNLKLDTQADGIKIHDSTLEIADSTCIIDLMETSSTNHRIINSSGNFQIQKISDDKSSTTLQFLVDGGSGAVQLYHNGTKNLETTSEGVKIDGGLLEIAHTSCHIDFMETSTTNHRLRNGSGNFQIQKISDDKSTTTTQFLIDGGTEAVQLYFNGSKKMETTANGVLVAGELNVLPTSSTFVTVNKDGTGILVSLRTTGTERGNISSNGSTVQFNTSSSDKSMKKNFEDWTENTLSLFKNINPQRFNFLDQEDGTDKEKGFIAQDLVTSFPEAYPKINDKYMFNPSAMVVYLMKAIQELEAEVAVLKAA